MTERYLLFDSLDGDRVTLAADFAAFFKAIAGTGFISNFQAELEVTENNPQDMSVLISEGAAMLEGYYYQIYDEAKEISISAADATNDRIDRIVIRLDLPNRLIEADVLTGTPAASPTAPSLTRDSDTYEISLAQILVAANTTDITTGDITDERADDSVCGSAHHPGAVNLYGDTMRGDLDMNNNQMKDIRRLFFTSRYGQAGEVIGITESGTTGELLFSVYDADKNFVELVGAINKDSILREDRFQGLNNPNRINIGPTTADGEKYFEPSGSGFRIKYDVPSYLFVGETTVAFYMNSDPVHIFRENGSKSGGSIKIDGKLWGMSPTDSPRSLIEDVFFGINVDGRTEVMLDKRLAAAVASYNLMVSNQKIKIAEKRADRFILEGDGVTDVSLQGVRYDTTEQYYVDMAAISKGAE